MDNGRSHGTRCCRGDAMTFSPVHVMEALLCNGPCPTMVFAATLTIMERLQETGDAYTFTAFAFGIMFLHLYL